MNTKRCIISIIVVWLVNILLQLILNVVIIDWGTAEGTIGAEQMSTVNYMLGYIGRLVFAAIFCYIFTKAYEGKGVFEGIRYGAYIGILIIIPNFFDFLGNFTWPARIIWGHSIGTFIITVILGIVVYRLYKPKAA